MVKHHNKKGLKSLIKDRAKRMKGGQRSEEDFTDTVGTPGEGREKESQCQTQGLQSGERGAWLWHKRRQGRQEMVPVWSF